MSDVPGGFILAFCFFIVSRQGRFCQAASLLSSRLLCVAVFNHILRGGEEKIALIEEFVSGVLRFLIIDLTFHVVTLQSDGHV